MDRQIEQPLRSDLSLLEEAKLASVSFELFDKSIEELAIGGMNAKKELLIANLTSSISFISPVAMLTMAAIGTTALGPVSLTVMGLFALLSTKGAFSKHKAVLYKAFFEPNDKLVIELDDTLKNIISTSKTLKHQYNLEMKAMFSELKLVPEKATKKEARMDYRKIYIKHMTEFLFTLNRELPSLPISKLQKERFKKLQQQLKRKRLL